MEDQGKVAILMGSASDKVKMDAASVVLQESGISFDTFVMSAHREPARVSAFAREAREAGYAVVICGAGLAAHLAGAVAANTDLPVIGVPLSGGLGGGQDALLATVQMPKGVPVATVGVDNSANAAWLAIRILNAVPQRRVGYERTQTKSPVMTDTAMCTREAVIAAGKTKTLYSTRSPRHLVMEFRDDVTANNGEKHEVIEGKGASACAFNALIMAELARNNIPTHFCGLVVGERNAAIVERLQMLPLEAVIRNSAAGSLCRRLGIEKGRVFSPPLFELFYKSDELNDPLVTAETATTMKWATAAQLGEMEKLTRKVNRVVGQLLIAKGIDLVDFKIEFGVNDDGELVVGDEFSPDSCRMVDAATGGSMDKDVFRLAIGDLRTTYQSVLDRIGDA